MFKEDKKEAPAFSGISKLSAAANPPPRTAREEWECVHSYEDALKWHLKWTPWFTKSMIEGILKYAYPAEILKEGKDKILNFNGKIENEKTSDGTRISMHVTVVPAEEKEKEEEKIPPGLKIPIRRTESTNLGTDKEEKVGEEIQEELEKERINRFERFWTLNP